MKHLCVGAQGVLPKKSGLGEEGTGVRLVPPGTAAGRATHLGPRGSLITSVSFRPNGASLALQREDTPDGPLLTQWPPAPHPTLAGCSIQVLVAVFPASGAGVAPGFLNQQCLLSPVADPPPRSRAPCIHPPCSVPDCGATRCVVLTQAQLPAPSLPCCVTWSLPL